MVVGNKVFEEIRVLGIKFHRITVCDLLNSIVEYAKQGKKTVIGNVNTRGMNFAYDLPWYRDFINQSELVFCDGFGVLLGAKMLGYSVQNTHRMTCPDYIESLVLLCEQHNLSLYLLAGKPGVVDKAMEQMKAIAPSLRVAGHHGHFQKTGYENDDIIADINRFKPDVFYVGFGMPLQEKWIVDNFDRIDAKVFLPLGACLDFYTGTVYRGPQWMTDRGLEWLSRLLVEPGRLWRRYIVGNPLFFYRVCKQIVQKRLRTLRA